MLPDFFAGMPQKNEQAFLDLKAELRDTAQHVEETTLSLSVARSELELTAIPEAGAPVLGVENLLYVLTAYPDGRPAVCRVFLNGTAYQSDAQGVSEVKLGPDDANRQLELQAIDSAGRKTKVAYRADTNGPPPAFLLRTDKAVYQAGQSARVSIISPEKQNTVFIDVIKDNQTLLTKSVALENHKATYSLALPPSLVGALKVNAYVITEIGEDRGCSRIIYVNPASGLQGRHRVIQGRLSARARLPNSTSPSPTEKVGPLPPPWGSPPWTRVSLRCMKTVPDLLQQFLDVEGDLLKPRYQIKTFDCPVRFLSGENENQALAQAYFASLDRQPAGPGIDDLVKNGYIPQRLIENAREMRGTPAYEKYRKDPQYAEVMRLLEGERGIYSLREATGPVKRQSVEAHRKAYFKKLGEYLGTGFLGLLFFSPVLLLLYYARPGAGINPEALAQTQSARYVQIAGSAYNVLGVLTLLPLICYPFGFLALEHGDVPGTGWILLGFETVVVLSTLIPQLLRIGRAEAENLRPEMAPLRVFAGAFLVQFLVSRAGFATMFIHSPPGEGFAILWFLGSIIAPLVVLGGLGSHVRRQLAAKGITATSRRLETGRSSGGHLDSPHFVRDVAPRARQSESRRR